MMTMMMMQRLLQQPDPQQPPSQQAQASPSSTSSPSPPALAVAGRPLHAVFAGASVHAAMPLPLAPMLVRPIAVPVAREPALPALPAREPGSGAAADGADDEDDELRRRLKEDVKQSLAALPVDLTRRPFGARHPCEDRLSPTSSMTSSSAHDDEHPHNNNNHGKRRPHSPRCQLSPVCSRSNSPHSPRSPPSPPSPRSPRSPTPPSTCQPSPPPSHQIRRGLAFSVKNILDPNMFTGQKERALQLPGHLAMSGALGGVGGPLGVPGFPLLGATAAGCWRPHLDTASPHDSSSGERNTADTVLPLRNL